MNKEKFSFSWKYKDFEIRTTHSLDHSPYIELVKWDTNGRGEAYCFTLAYWHRGKDGSYNLIFVGERPWEYIAEIDIAFIWKQLFIAQQMFEVQENLEDCE